MVLDLMVLLALALFTLAGYRSGAVRQLSHWIGLGAACFLTKPAAALLAPLAAERLGWPAGPAAAGLSVVLYPAILLVSMVTARVILNLLEPGEEQGPLDEALGAPVGAAKGAAFAFVGLCLLANMDEAFARFQIDLPARTKDSVSMRFARQHNPFTHEPKDVKDAARLTLEALRGAGVRLHGPDAAPAARLKH
ncbi:MAG: CvpA family protein [Elusimicrobia bacterium]|nr:CvpA family protein [Elusimicrobiota bacterium]